MAAQAFQLVMRSGPSAGKVYDLNQAEITIGRDINSDIVINDAEVSRRHARLVGQAGGFVLEDLGSTNGTFVNGQRLMGPHLLRPGEMVLLGENVSLSYQQAYDPDATVASSLGATPPAGMPLASAAAAPVQPAPAPQPVYSPPSTMMEPQPVQAAPQPVYSGVIPASPQPIYEEEEEQTGSRTRTWIFLGCGLLLVMACIVVVGAFIFDAMNLYCTPPFNLIFSPCP
jgi:predicted component of type VI protein secretion system